MLDPFVVTVALPAIRSDLGATAAQVQWIVAGYGAVYGTALVLGGRLGDRYGRRRLFVAGMGAYPRGLGRGRCRAHGRDPRRSPARTGARRGGGAAAGAVDHPRHVRRGGAGTSDRPVRPTIGLGVVCGPVVGGLLVGTDVEGLGWRSVFLMNVPLGAVVIAGAALAAPECTAGRGVAVPATGCAIVVAAVGALVVVAAAAPAELRSVLLAPVLLVAGIGQGFAVNPVIALVLAAAPEWGRARRRGCFSPRRRSETSSG